MYSHEITNIVNQYSQNIPSTLYVKIIQTSPQINHVKYDPYGNYYEMWDEKGVYWKYSVYNKN